ncbi:MAG: hypothetical protein FWC03_12980 [Treponema sp.]|nr:hypothetical protein [Treponema sp.]
MKFARKFFSLIILLSFSSPAFAQSAIPPWLSLEYGKQKFRSGEYGNALMLFEDARRDRRSMYEKMERDLINFLSTREARVIGDSLDIIDQFTRDRYYTAVSAALDELYYRVSRQSLNNSALAALGAIGKLKDYPEAEYWIGEVYRVEGELSLALAQYRKTYAMRELFENQGFGTELQYKIAGILLVRQDYNEMQRVLNSIIDEHDTLWADARNAVPVNTGGLNSVSVSYNLASASFASQAMTRTLENEGINRFLELYRYNNAAVEEAHRRLGFFYAVTGRDTAQQHLMYAFLIQNTVIIEELVRHQFDFRFTTLNENRENQARNLTELSRAIGKNTILASYIEEVEYYKTAYYLGASLYKKSPSIARSIWEFLGSQPQAGEWQSRAVLQLRNPQFEPIVENP